MAGSTSSNSGSSTKSESKKDAESSKKEAPANALLDHLKNQFSSLGDDALSVITDNVQAYMRESQEDIKLLGQDLVESIFAVEMAAQIPLPATPPKGSTPKQINAFAEIIDMRTKQHAMVMQAQAEKAIAKHRAKERAKKYAGAAVGGILSLLVKLLIPV